MTHIWLQFAASGAWAIASCGAHHTLCTPYALVQCTTCQTRSMLRIQLHYFMAKETTDYVVPLSTSCCRCCLRSFFMSMTVSTLSWSPSSTGITCRKVLLMRPSCLSNAALRKQLSVKKISLTQDQDPPAPVHIGTKRSPYLCASSMCCQ